MDPDRSAIERVLSGEVGAYAEIIRRHERPLYRLILGIVADRDLADDVLQETYLIAYRQLASFKGEARFVSWVSRIAVREAMRARSRARRAWHAFIPLERVRGELLGRGISPVDGGAASARFELDGALVLLSRLSVRERAAFVLHVVEEQTYEEIAKQLRCRPGTVGSLIHRARKRLADLVSLEEQREDRKGLKGAPLSAVRGEQT